MESAGSLFGDVFKGSPIPIPPPVVTPKRLGRPPKPKDPALENLPKPPRKPPGRKRKDGSPAQWRPVRGKPRPVPTQTHEVPPLDPGFEVHLPVDPQSRQKHGPPPEPVVEDPFETHGAETVQFPKVIPARVSAEPSLDTREGVLSTVKALILDPEARMTEKLKAIERLCDMQGYDKNLNLDSIRRMSNEQLIDIADEVILALETFGVRKVVEEDAKITPLR